ncbi:MAG: hypothetical protein F4014_01880 [Gemmatimonadetes bacterium]|nr:hypothetical protein [Gemmatimonadota bacterium]MYH19740.1 hypothetical protein [Gemmatimonadota bacterium]MYK97586.1 hypothetical protein [Gemmatimonadota bacterium]
MSPGLEALQRQFARLPSVRLLQGESRIEALRDRFEDGQIDAAIRKVLCDARDRIRLRPPETEADGHAETDGHAEADGHAKTDGFAPERLAERAAARLESEARSAGEVPINGSGIIFHPLVREHYAGTAAGSASRLGLTLAAYEEDGRTAGLVRDLTGAEDVLVCRSVADAFLLAVRALAGRAEVVIGRSQAGLIDAPFEDRPVSPVSLCALACATMVEAGATNKSRLSDYRSAMGNRTALIVTARPSTCALRGFTEEAAPEEIARAGAESGATVLHLAGDTTLRPVPSAPFAARSSVTDAVRSGTPLTIAAGGGLIGGPPCGLLIGTRQVIARLRAHGTWPAAQASRHVRAGFDARLAELAEGSCDLACHPAAHMLAATGEAVGARARLLCESLSEDRRLRGACDLIESQTYLTAYRLPADALPGYAVSIRPPDGDPAGLAARWLKATPPLLAECGRDRVRIDMRGVARHRIVDVARIVRSGL